MRFGLTDNFVQSLIINLLYVSEVVEVAFKVI